MEMAEIIRQRLTGQGLCSLVCILECWADTEVERERERLEDEKRLIYGTHRY